MLRRYDGKPVSGRLVYRRSEHSLDVEPKPARGVTSLLVNDIQIEVDEDGRLVFVWGLCPQESWTTAKVQPPEASTGRLLFVGGTIVPGVSKRLNAGKRWTVFHDPTTRWLCVGEQSGEGELVAFAPGAVAKLNGGEMTALWLQPDVME
jgi:hypothetical protein